MILMQPKRELRRNPCYSLCSQFLRVQEMKTWEDLKFTSLRGTRVVMLIMAPLLTAVYVAGPLGMLFWSLFFDRHSLFLSLFACCILPFGIWIGRFMLRDALGLVQRVPIEQRRH